MLAYLDGFYHTQFWPHSIFINNHANVTYFLTVSLTYCHISNSVWQYTALTNGFHINSPQKIKKGKVFLHMLAYLDGFFHTQFWLHSIFINNHANVTYFLTVSLTYCHISNSVWQYTALTNGFHINSPQKIKKGKVFLKK